MDGDKPPQSGGFISEGMNAFVALKGRGIENAQGARSCDVICV
jgi:hypothetical protein